MLTGLMHFSGIWIVVAGVRATPGEQLVPVAFAAKELRGDRVIEVGTPRLLSVKRAPYPTGSQTLLITVDAHELVGLHQALSWRMPERLIDLMIEFRNDSNGHSGMRIGGLPGALLWHGLPTGGALVAGSSPEHMRHRLYAVAKLFDAMRPSLDVGRALLRGRYLCAIARIEATGIPIDRVMLSRLVRNWPDIRNRVVGIVDAAYHIYRGGRFDIGAFASWLDSRGIDWPVNADGRLDLADDTFRDMARTHPELRPIKELRATVGQLDPRAMTVGRDSRNRTPLRPFASSTGRNQPSAKASVLGSAAWVRHLVKPQPGTGLAVIDWQQQELGIGAALSDDPAMQEAYRSGDPYLALAIAVGAVPAGATAASHPFERERYKLCALGMLYGMGTRRLARQLGLAESAARALVDHHHRVFHRFWAWLDAVETHALLHRELRSVFGWRISVDADTNPRSLRNFPMQANGAEMLRLACCLATERGIKVCAPNHDALLIEAPIDELDHAVHKTRRLMAEASSTVLGGLELRTSVRMVRAPDRWTEPKGAAVWSAVIAALGARAGPAHQRD